MPELTRRSLLAGAAVAATGGVAGFATARTSAAARGRSGTSAANAYGNTPAGAGRRLAGLDQVPPGGGIVLTDPAVVITRGAGNQVHAFSAICTHQGCPVNKVCGGTIDCPCHGSRFDATTGRVVAGPAPAPLPPVTVEVREGGIYTA